MPIGLLEACVVSNYARKLISRENPVSRAFDNTIMGLIAFSIILITLETVPEFQRYHTLFHACESVIVAIFTMEYGIRLMAARRMRDYMLSPSGIIDLLAIVPYFMSFGVVDMQVLRIFRLFRVLRILKLARYTKAMHRLNKAFVEIREELAVFMMATFFLIYMASAGIYHFEHHVQPEKFKSIFHSMWWAIATVTTVGYGDIVPITAGGKILTFFVLLLGLGIISIPSALIASAMIDERAATRKKQQERVDREQSRVIRETAAKITRLEAAIKRPLEEKKRTGTDG
jgi:voltage-gated potassium channel